MSVTPAVAPTVTVSGSSSICSGSLATITATITNGGAAPAYQWKVNGNQVGTSSSTYTCNALVNGDVVTCELTSNANCASPATVVSNQFQANVVSNTTPSVSIIASSTTICSGAPITFTATAVNGGNAPAYQWKVNGNNAGTNSSTFTTSALNSGDVVSCDLTSNAACVTTNSATSNTITLTVGSSVTPFC
jgi:hypothetical protein